MINQSLWTETLFVLTFFTPLMSCRLSESLFLYYCCGVGLLLPTFLLNNRSSFSIVVLLINQLLHFIYMGVKFGFQRVIRTVRWTDSRVGRIVSLNGQSHWTDSCVEWIVGVDGRSRWTDSRVERTVALDGQSR